MHTVIGVLESEESSNFLWDFFFFKILYVCVYMCTSALGGQKRHQIPLEAELQEALNFCLGCWQLNSVLLQEQGMLFTH